MNEAENTVRTQMKNRKGTDTFVASARIATYNKIFGLSVASAYRQPSLPGGKSAGAQPKSRIAEKDFDMSKYSG
jgi:hypothetical protein